MREQSISLYQYEDDLRARGISPVAGVDEAGRGPLAGPVVAAAVILPKNKIIPGLNDSKQLKPAQREALFGEILASCDVGIALAVEKEIDTINIYQAARQAMLRALSRLRRAPGTVLVDGKMNLLFSCPCVDIIKGDQLSASIAAASIVAKVVRDQIMLAYHELAPQFAFDVHKGYGTPAHLQAIREHGPSVYHRYSFYPMKKDAQGAFL